MESPQQILTSTTAHSFIARKSHSNVIFVKTTDSLHSTLKTLVNNKIHGVPVFDPKTEKFVAFVDLLDFAAHLVRTYLENQIIEGSISRMLEEEHHYVINEIANESRRNPWCTVNFNTPLLQVMSIMTDKKIHRVAVVDEKGQLTNVITMSDLVQYIFNNLQPFSSLKGKTVEELHLGIKEVVSTTTTEKTYKAFLLMNSSGVSGVAVLDEQGKIVGNISAGDLKRLDFNLELMKRLSLSVAEYCNLGTAEQKPFVLYVTPKSTFEEVLEKLVTTRMHRVYIVNEEQKPVGVISQMDVLDIVLKSCQ